MLHALKFNILFLCIFVQALAFADDRSHYILVTIAPYKYFVEKIVGDTEQAGILVPPGASPHYFEPTAKQVMAASKADIWFRMGEGFEQKALKSLNLKTVDLREGINLLYEATCCCAHEGDPDPHIWMSPRTAKKQAETIAKTLISIYPENRDLFTKNLSVFLKELDQLDMEITTLLKPYKGRSIMVSHPAYAYFCRDYEILQIPIEFEGKDPSPQQLTKILDLARNAKIKTVFIQQQHSSKGARLIAREIGANVETIDPLSENYTQNIKEIAQKFFNSFN